MLLTFWVGKLTFSKGFFLYVHLGERSFGGATNRKAGTTIVHLRERCSFRGATNKSAVTAPLNEHMKKKL